MRNDKELPSTETPETPRPPAGENMKDLVTPGPNADAEAEAQTDDVAPGGGMPGVDAANPPADEAPEEEQSPT